MKYTQQGWGGYAMSDKNKQNGLRMFIPKKIYIVEKGMLYEYEISVKEIYIYNDEASEQEVIFKNEFIPKKKYIVEKGKIKK